MPRPANPRRVGLAFPNFNLTCVHAMLNYPASIKYHLTYLVPLPLMIEDEHDDIVPALDIGLLNPMSAAERRTLLLIIAAELMMFLGDECAWIVRLDLARTTIVLEQAFRDPHPAYDKLVAFCRHWKARRAELAA